MYGTTVLPAFIIFSLIPWYGIFYAALHFGMTSLVLFFILRINNIQDKKLHYKKRIMRMWLSGVIASYAGPIYLIFIGYIASSISINADINKGIIFSIAYATNGYTYHDKWSFLFIVSGIFVSSVSIFLTHFIYSLKKFNIKATYRVILSFFLAMTTAPYVYLIPSELLPS